MDIVERFRFYGDEPQDVSHGEIAEWMHKGADLIEQQQRELDELRKVRDEWKNLAIKCGERRERDLERLEKLVSSPPETTEAK